MQTLNTFPIIDPYQDKEYPIAIYSGDIIYILYPDGQVEVTTTEKLEKGQTQSPLNICLVWGYFAEF
jgi:ArsR family metal-binding transcriptional regulator